MWITTYLLKRGRGYRVGVDDVPAFHGWVIAEEHSVWHESSTDIAALKNEVDRQCQGPLSQKEARALLSAIRGHVVGQSLAVTTATTDKYSTFWPRFGAAFLDGFVVWPVLWLLEFGFAQASIPLRLVLYVILRALDPAYSIWMHGKYGQTLGKMACGIVVRDVSERRLSMRQAVWRDIFQVALFPVGLFIDIPRILQGTDIFAPTTLTATDVLIVTSTFLWFSIEVITMLTNRKRRALHDFIAGSVVIRKHSPVRVSNLSDASSALIAESRKE
jgi:uncharacterized RDD family membrane protein YckC